MKEREVKPYIVQNDAWTSLRKLTNARIALGRTGTSEPLKASLAFKLAHAYARDAVYSELEKKNLLTDLETFNLPVYYLKSKAKNRTEYLQRPDFGRSLDEDSRRKLENAQHEKNTVVIVLADGLSATAINQQAIPLLRELIPLLAKERYTIASLVIVEGGRVAIADEIGHLLHSEISAILIGERPGLTSPHSMGAYLTYLPKPGLSDEKRNCISNIHSAGLSCTEAAQKIFLLIKAALQLKISGVTLKEKNYLQ